MKNDKKKIVIIGGKGTAVVIAEQIIDAHERFGMNVEFLGFAFDDESYGGKIGDYPILCKTTEAKSKYEKYNDVMFIYSLYRSDLIKERTELLLSYNISVEKFYTFIHPTAYIARSAKIGYGNVICANTVINPNVVIGNYNTFNSACLIGHDTKMGNNNFFAAHACIGSNLKIKNGVFVGLNTSVRNFVEMDDYCIVGMGSNVIKNVEKGQVVIGNPAVARKKFE